MAIPYRTAKLKSANILCISNLIPANISGYTVIILLTFFSLATTGSGMTISEDEDKEADITIIDSVVFSLLFLADPDIAAFNNHTQVVSK